MIYSKIICCLKALFIITLWILLGNLNETCSEEFPLPIYPIDNKEIKTLKVENLYRYNVVYYKQPLKIEIINRKSAKYGTPEDAFISFVSSIKHIDIKWYINCWDIESRKQMKDDFENMETIQKKTEAWKEIYTDKEIFLKRRVERKSIIIFDYVVKRSIKDKNEFQSHIKFKKINKEWKATNLFSDDPVWVNYGKDKISIIH